MPNPVMSKEFESAMNCVLRGGKAWRKAHRNSPERVFMLLDPDDDFTIVMLHESDFPDGPTELHAHDLCRDDLTATDWVWSEPANAEEAS